MRGCCSIHDKQEYQILVSFCMNKSKAGSELSYPVETRDRRLLVESGVGKKYTGGTPRKHG